MKVDNMDDTYWIGVGVTLDFTAFSYNIPSIYGYASNGRALAPSWVYALTSPTPSLSSNPFTHSPFLNVNV